MLPRAGQPLGHRPADRAAAPRRTAGTLQRDPAGGAVVGVPEPLGELDDAPGLGAPEGVDGLVGIADGDEVAAAAGEQLEEFDLGGVGVLVLVDEQPPGPLRSAQQFRVVVSSRIAWDQLRGVVAGRVAAARGGEGGDRLVLLLEGGGVHPVLAARLPAPRGQLRGATPVRSPAAAARAARSEARRPERRASPTGQRTAPSSSASPRSSSATTASCSADVSSRGGGVTAEQRGPAENPVGVGVEGAGQRLADGLAHPAGDAGPQLGRGLAAEGQDEDLLRVDAGLDTGGDRLDDDRRRLARAGPGQDEQRPAGVVDDGLLGRVQPGRAELLRGSPATSR